MPLIKEISVRNFRCFRQTVTVELGQSTYLIGRNNSGKTSFLAAIRCFFDTSAYSPDFLNKTERSAKKRGSQRSDITVTFDLSAVPAKERKRRLIEEFGKQIIIRKGFTWRDTSGTIDVSYQINRKNYQPEDLPPDLAALLDGVSISYIHPQEGSDLLRKAQEKFKQRLFSNWGRHASMADKLKAVQVQWDDLRKMANSYLSSALTSRLRTIWPDSTTKVDLPERIEDIVAISDFTFRSNQSLPEVTLSQHGTGAQSIILYQTHYVLDSDRTLHRGLYAPMWLLEEPESFLHGDIAFQLGSLLSSPEWLGEIQMVISTHSPIILAASRKSADATVWAVFREHALSYAKNVSSVTTDEVLDIGRLMGDSNFAFYFDASGTEPTIVIEDSRALTVKLLQEAGVPVSRSTGGVHGVERFIDAISPYEACIGAPLSFLVDGDKAFKSLRVKLEKLGAIATSGLDGWRHFKIGSHIRVAVLPDSFAIEDLFSEWEGEVGKIAASLVGEDLNLLPDVPTDLTRLVAELRSKKLNNRSELFAFIRAHQDAKDRFWRAVQTNEFKMVPKHVHQMKVALGLIE
jgi:hypothetical protein